MKFALLTSACALVLAAASPASAEVPWSGTLSGDFGNFSGFPTWDVNGTVQIPLDFMDLSLQPTGGIEGIGPVHHYDGGGDLVWNGDQQFRLAFTAIYNEFNFEGVSFSETQVGGGGEWYALPWLTLSAQGGALAGNSSGGYVGGTVKGYIFPDLSVAGTIDYASLHNENVTAYGAHAEWVPTEEFPVGITGTYSHVVFSGMGLGGSDTDLWLVGLKLHLNEAGEIPLVQHDRTGTLDTIGGPISAAIGVP